MQENILENLEKDFITCSIICDLSKAISQQYIMITVDYDVLLWKLGNFFGMCSQIAGLLLVRTTAVHCH